MTHHIQIECPPCSPEEKVSHELIKLGTSPLVHCLECGLVYVASGIKTPEKVSVRVFVNRIEQPFHPLGKAGCRRTSKGRSRNSPG